MAEADWNIDLTQEGSSLSGSGKESAFINRTYSSQYRVLTGDATVSAKAIERHFQRTSSLPWYGRAWKWSQGTNTDRDFESICVGIDVKHEPQSTGKFMVECKFEPKNDKTEKEKPDNTEEGDDTNDPLEWRDQVSITYVQQSFPATRGTFRGFTQGSPFGGNDKPAKGTMKLLEGTTYVPCGSNLVPYDPLPEIEEQIKVIRFVRNIPEWDSADADPWIGVVNSERVTIVKRQLAFRVQIPALHGRIVNINGSSEFENGKRFWRREIEVHVHPRGWRGRYPDMGLVSLPNNIEEDGYTSPGDLVNKPRQNEQISMKDDQGTPTPSPVLLDGFGRPLRTQDISKTMWTNWQFYPEVNWAPVVPNF